MVSYSSVARFVYMLSLIERSRAGDILAKAIPGAYVIQLSSRPSASSSVESRSQSYHALFHKRAAASLPEYTTRYEFTNSDFYFGLSVQVTNTSKPDGDLRAALGTIPGVVSVAPVYEAHILDAPGNEFAKFLAPDLSFSNPGAMPTPSVAPTNVGGSNSTLAISSALQMGGVDKLHALGITGRGVKVGIIDTGVDYRHAALGGGFGPGFKVVGGHSWVADDGARKESDDPFVACFGGGHGTHVTGIVGMDALRGGGEGNSTGGFPLSGVAPEADLYMYRIFDCTSSGGTSDQIMAAMERAAFVDRVDVLSMSLSIGQIPTTGGTDGDPLADVVRRVTDAGVAVVVAVGNSGNGGHFATPLYSEEMPASEPAAVAVGSVANAAYPLSYPVLEPVSGKELRYASIWPVDLQSMDVYMLEDGCSGDAWDSALAALTAAGALNRTVVSFPITDYCRPTDAQDCCRSPASAPHYTLGYWTANNSDGYNKDFYVPSPGFFGANTQFLGMGLADGEVLVKAYHDAGGFGKYHLAFPAAGAATYSPLPQLTGGFMDTYTSWGPTRLTYDLKPQLSAPGGNVLSTWPLGSFSGPGLAGAGGGYAIISGTSMATPYVAGCFALAKSAHPDWTMQEIKERMQAAARPVQWIWDKSILAATAQQGGGLADCFAAVMGKSKVGPGQVALQDDATRSAWGTGNVSIHNGAQETRTYTLGHKGAAYANQYNGFGPDAGLSARYGSAAFSGPATLTLAAGQSTAIPFSISPPAQGVDPSRLPVMGGFVTVDSTGVTDDEPAEHYSIPYVGPAYSLYHAGYIHLLNLTDNVQPQVRFYYASDPDTAVVAGTSGLVRVNASVAFGSIMAVDQWTTAYRIDLVPANTTFAPDHWGFDPTKAPASGDYVASKAAPVTAILGVPSYGTLVDQEGGGAICSCSNLSPSGKTGGGTIVAKSKGGDKYTPGAGDYRWLLSVRRWGGVDGVRADHDTWLGPVVRFIEGPV